MLRNFICSNGYCEVSAWQKGAWTSVVAPTPEESQLLVDEFAIPQSFLSDINDSEERPRVEYEDGWRMVIIRVPYKTGDQESLFTTVPLGVLTNELYFVTVCHYPIEMLDDFIQYSHRKGHVNKSPTDLLLHLSLSSSVWFMKYLKYINWETKEAEKMLQRSIRNEELLELMRLERTLVYFITSIRGNEVLIQKLKNLLKVHSLEYDPELLEDVEIELQQARNMANVHSDILSGMMDAFASVISNNLNVQMKRLTSASIILMIPTLIASFYGMNVPNSLEGKSYGFVLIMIVSVLISVVTAWAFVKKKWL